MNYTNHFGEKSSDYLRFRPDYPRYLYEYIVSEVRRHDLAWDAGTGNGQAAIKLAEYFNYVIATDINQAQLDVANKKDNIQYHCWSSEKTDIADATVDLVTVAQALHWFNFDGFYQEVRRVAMPESILAAWCYSLGQIDAKLDPYIKVLYEEILGDTYWPRERRFIDEAYTAIPFPFKKIKTPQFNMIKQLDFADLVGYLNTWSAVKEYQKRNQKNPIDLIFHDLQKAWGVASTKKTMQWSIHLLMGRV